MSKKRRISRRTLLTSLPAVISSGSCSNSKEGEPPPSVNFTSGEIADEELAVISAETQLPVPGAKIWGPFQGDFITDEEGKVTVRVGEGYPLEVNIEGYLKRETRFRRDGKTISLWPILAQDDLHFKDLLYFKGELRSLQASRVAVSFGSGVSDQRIIAAHEQAISRINALTDGRITFGVRPSSAQVAITISVNPEDPQFQLNPMWGGYASLSVSASVIKGATVVYRDIQRAIALAQHELGHCLGLGHTLADGPWMMNPSNYYLVDDFNGTEKRAVRFSLLREPRWLPLDNDRDRSPVVSAAVQPETYIVGC